MDILLSRKQIRIQFWHTLSMVAHMQRDVKRDETGALGLSTQFERPEALPQRLVRLADDHKSGGIGFVNQGLDLGDLCTADDAVKDRPVGPGVGPLPESTVTPRSSSRMIRPATASGWVVTIMPVRTALEPSETASAVMPLTYSISLTPLVPRPRYTSPNPIPLTTPPYSALRTRSEGHAAQ
jgi:hypothetical protein